MKETHEQKLAMGPMSGLRTAAPAADAPGANDVGPLLCATRMRLGKDLQDVARLLHIRYNYLVAIEDGRFEDLPGQAYAIGFVRAYAEHLDLDGDEIVRRFKDENAGIKKPTAFNYPLPAPDSGVPSVVLLMIAVVMGMMVYGAWYSIAGADRRAADLIQEIPVRLAAMLDRPPAPQTVPAETPVVNPEPVKVVETPLAPVAADPPKPEPAKVEPARTEVAAVEAPKPEVPKSEPPKAEPPKPEASTQVAALTPAPPAPRQNSKSTDVIELKATSDSWIQVRAGDQLLLTRLLRKGEVYRVPDRNGLTLMTGNAGGIEVSVNGDAMPPLGSEGTVARGVPLEAARLRTMAKAAVPVETDDSEPD